MLPADAADTQAGDLITALAGEEPGEGHRADHLDGVDAAVSPGQVGGLQVEPGPQQLGPDVVSDHPGIRSDQGSQAARGAQGRGRVEPAGNPFPFLQVTEERARYPQVARLGLG